MSELRLFAWFTQHSWRYMRGQRLRAVRSFWPSWRRFAAACAADRSQGFQ